MERVMRVAIYARVSTNGKNGEDDEAGRRHVQDTDNQLLQLRKWCATAGHVIVEEYVERVSGGKGKDRRPEFARMLDDAHKRRFDIVLCWALDRFSREGMIPTIGHLQRLAAAGVGFHSYTEPMLSTDNEMIRDIVLAVMASLAKQERLRHVERIHAGIARARIKGTASGKPIGRPGLDKRKEAAIRAELRKGTGILKTARLCGTGVSAAQRIKREMAAAAPGSPARGSTSSHSQSRGA
jgi:DNA invertase Pin-like site-specific DNA recombinase